MQETKFPERTSRERQSADSVRETARRLPREDEASAPEPLVLETAPLEPQSVQVADSEPIESELDSEAPTRDSAEDERQKSAERARRRLGSGGSTKAGKSSKSGLFGFFKKG